MNQEYTEITRQGLSSMYGEEVPLQARLRAETEMSFIKYDTFMDDILLMYDLRETARKDGFGISAGYNDGASFLNWIYAKSPVNPLPPHCHCPQCKRTQFFPDGDAWDLDEYECCGVPMIREGHNIPFESIRRAIDNPKSELELHVAASFTDTALKIIEDHYADQYNMIPYQAEIISGYDYVLIPKEDGIPELDQNGVWHTSCKELYDSGYRLVKLKCEEIKEQLKTLRLSTGTEPDIYELLAAPIFQAVKEKLENQIQEEEPWDPDQDAEKPLLTAEKLNFSLLVRMKGYLHATYYKGNPALRADGTKYSSIFTCREDVWNLVSPAIRPEYGVSKDFAEKVMRYTRMGRYTYDRMDEGTETLLRELGISDYWITQMKHTCYLLPKARIIEKLLDEMELAWYQLRGDTSVEIAN
jgi:hypothetical protein